MNNNAYNVPAIMADRDRAESLLEQASDMLEVTSDKLRRSKAALKEALCEAQQWKSIAEDFEEERLEREAAAAVSI